MSSNESAQPLALTEGQIALTRRCLAAAVDGPFFQDWEIGTLIGAGRDELRSIGSAWPQLRHRDDLALVSNVVANLLHYPHRLDEVLYEQADTSRDELEQLMSKILATQRPDHQKR
jgi:hypothetical protein